MCVCAVDVSVAAESEGEEGEGCRKESRAAKSGTEEDSLERRCRTYVERCTNDD